MTETKTIQLRRYQLIEGKIPDFLEVFRTRVSDARRVHGFDVEFGFLIAESNEFVWAVSYPGDADAFRAAEATYSGSPERAHVLEVMSACVVSARIDLVETIA